MSCSLFFIGCKHDDVLENDPNQSHNEDALKGKTFVLTQGQLESKYSGNKNLNNILKKEFKTEGGLIKTNSADEGQNGVYIDLDHIQVLESAQMHAITYYVEIGEQEETDEPQEVYNLMYFSTDYETYHVILYKYDFSQIPFQQFVLHPELTMNVLGFIPLNDIENIYENIKQSTTKVAKSTSSVSTNNYAAVYYQFINLADCAKSVVVEGKPCKGTPPPPHNYGDSSCSMQGNMQATPGYSYMDFSGCGGGAPGSGGGGGGGGSVGSPGGGGNPGGGGGGSTPANPIWSHPVKNPGNLIAIGTTIGQINIGTNNKNLEVLNGIVENNLATLQDLHSKANATREHGNAFIKVKKNLKYVPLANQTPLQLVNNSNWALNIESAVKIAANTGIIHSHTNKNTIIYEYNKPTKADPMFSHTDLRALFLLSADNTTNNKELPDLFFGLMTSESLYVVMFPNDATKTNFVTKYGTPFFTWKNDIEKWDKIGRGLRDEYGKISPSTATDAVKAKMYEKALLKVLKDNNLPLNFYRLDANNGQFNGSWKLLKLDANNNVTENQGH